MGFVCVIKYINLVLWIYGLRRPNCLDLQPHARELSPVTNLLSHPTAASLAADGLSASAYF